MKKNDFIYLAIFLVVALLVPPMSAFLTSKIIGLESTQSIWCRVYIFFKDQGSFIGGTLAFIGVIFVINSQWKSTTRIIDDASKRSDMDRFENYKDSADEAIYAIQEIGVRILPQAAKMVQRDQRFIRRDLFPESVFRSFRRECKTVRKFIDRYGDKTTAVVFGLIDGWYMTLDNFLKFEEDKELLETYICYLQYCMFNYSMLPKESKLIDVGVAIRDGEKLYFNDIRELSENLNVSNFEDILIFMEIVYVWIRRHAIHKVVSDIKRTYFCRT